MDRDTLQSLEWASILATLQNHCRTPAGAEELEAMDPCVEERRLSERRSPVAAVLGEIQRGRTPPTGQLPDTRPILAVLNHDAAPLNGLELRLLGDFLVGVEEEKNWLSQSAAPFLPDAVADWPSFSTEASDLTRLLSPTGVLDPQTNPGLARIVGAMAEGRRRQESAARKLLHDPALLPFWQDTTFSVRGERLVLPLKADFRGRVPGLVHHESGSGQTLFVEPFELVDLNNEWVRLEDDYRAESLCILKHLTDQLRARILDLLHSERLMGFWDSVVARAVWGHLNDGGFPQVAVGGAWKLLQARHPLLGKDAVPVTLECGAQACGMVLSGPNTGGKTVFLKTMAVLARLNQLGCPIPADPGSSLPLVRGIVADIGDRQSISEALSTYSAHLLRLKFILETSAPGFLVLLDELGTGTDPAEGGALGVAVLEALREKGAFVAVTTHTALVKQFPLLQPDYVSAAMEFDSETGRPTFRVVTGRAGGSRALETAQRLGLPQTLIQRARDFLEKSQNQAERRLLALDALEEEFRSRREIWDARRTEEARRREVAEEELRRWRQEKAAWERDRVWEHQRLLAEQRKEFECLVKNLKETQAGKKEILDTRAWLEAQARHNAEVAARWQEPLPLTEFDGHPGDLAYYQGRRVILEKKVKSGCWKVRSGVMSLEAPEAELQAAPQEKPLVLRFARDTTLTAEKAVHQLDLRGQRADEAKARLERQIDRALVDSLAEFSVVHGLGEGKLQTVVREVLRQHPHVKDFFYATPEEGGFGKTIVRI